MKIDIADVTPRDGLQNETVHLTTDDKINLIHQTIQAGAKRIEVTSFVSPRAIPQLADAEEVVAGIDLPDDVRLRALVPNLRGAERAARTRVHDWTCFVSATESHSLANSNKSVDAAIDGLFPVVDLARAEGKLIGGAIASAFGCPFEGITPVDQVVGIARRFRDMGMVELILGDTIGTATPSQVKTLLTALSDTVPELDIVLHLHDTRGLSLANVLVGMACGVDRYEATIGGIGGCPFAPGATGNVALEDLVHFLHAEGHETGYDLDRLIETGRHLSSRLGRDLPGKMLKAKPIGFTVPLRGVTRACG